MRRVVEWFADRMETTLAKHDQTKGGQDIWRGMSRISLLELLRVEVNELREELIKSPDPCVSDVISECTDIANFAMMIADNISYHYGLEFEEDEKGCPDNLADYNVDDKHKEIMESRQKVYGDPKENHRHIANTWTGLLAPHAESIARGEPLPIHVVALMLCGLKLSRMRRVYAEDNYDDMRNYLAFAEAWQREHDGNQNSGDNEVPF